MASFLYICTVLYGWKWLERNEKIKCNITRDMWAFGPFSSNYPLPPAVTVPSDIYALYKWTIGHRGWKYSSKIHGFLRFRSVATYIVTALVATNPCFEVLRTMLEMRWINFGNVFVGANLITCIMLFIWLCCIFLWSEIDEAFLLFLTNSGVKSGLLLWSSLCLNPVNETI